MAKQINYPNYSSIESTVKGGFPVLYWFQVGPAEPDVGIMSSYIDDWFVTDRRGRTIKFIEPTEADLDRMQVEAFDSIDREHDRVLEDIAADRHFDRTR